MNIKSKNLWLLSWVIIFAACMSVALTLTMSAFATTATETSINQKNSSGEANSLNTANETNLTTYTSTKDSSNNFLQNQQVTQNVANDINASLPESFDLRNVNGKNYVSSVKNQGFFGCCWAFSVMGASESSILRQFDLSYNESPIDLSEHHLSWFIAHHLPAAGEEGYVAGQTQAGEGFYPSEGAPALIGGMPYFGAFCFASGIGPVAESDYPYKGVGSHVLGRLGTSKYSLFNSAEEATSYGYTPMYYYTDGDWSLPESSRFTQGVKLEESSILPSVKPTQSTTGGIYDTLNTANMNIAKQKISTYGALAASYFADTNSSTPSKTRYFNTDTRSEYMWDTSKVKQVNHGTTIFGWDDNYDKSNFTKTQVAKWDSNNHPIYSFTDAGKACAKDSDDNPYYIDSAGAQQVIPVADRAYLFDITGSGSSAVYTWKSGELTNNAAGNPCFPGTENPITYYANICSVVHEAGTLSTPPGNGAWLCKNSWGAKNNSFYNVGDFGDGYFWLSYYDPTLGSLESYNFALTDTEEGYNYNLCYQYDLMAAKNISDLSFDSSTYSDYSYGNIFTADQDSNIMSVSCTTGVPSAKVQYDMYILKDGATSPTDGELVASVSEIYDYSGFHRANLGKSVYVAKGKRFSVVVKQTTTVTTNSNSTQKQLMPFTLSQNSNNAANVANNQGYYKAVINEGESFATYNKNGTSVTADWKNFINSADFNDISKSFWTGTNRSDWDIDNPNIKAYGTPTSSPVKPDGDGGSSDAAVLETAATGDSTPIIWEGLLVIAAGFCLVCSKQMKNSNNFTDIK